MAVAAATAYYWDRIWGPPFPISRSRIELANEVVVVAGRFPRSNTRQNTHSRPHSTHLPAHLHPGVGVSISLLT